MRWIFLLLLCSLLISISSPVLCMNAADEPSSPSAHTDAAELLVSQLDPDHNEYAYKDPFILWKGDPGIDQSSARCDCSAFITLLFQHTYRYTPEQIKQWMDHARPLAKVYHDTIEAGQGYTRIENINEIKRGDLIAVKYLVRDPGKKDTGHVMLATESPRRRESTPPLISGTTQWELVIIDSSKSGHGPTDTRRRPDKTFSTGIGRGTLRLYSDSKGNIAGYTWSTLSVSEFFPPEDHHVVVGRATFGGK